jgi:hypothetical protein
MINMRNNESACISAAKIKSGIKVTLEIVIILAKFFLTNILIKIYVKEEGV